MTTDLRRIRLHSGEIGLSLEPLLGRLQLGMDYLVLAAATHPTDTSRVFALVHLDPDGPFPKPTPYVVYRVDPRDGSCHGGQYVSSVNTAFLRFAERTAILGLDGEPGATGPVFQPASSAADDQSGEGYTVGKSYDELPAHTAQSEFYADNTQSGEH